MDSSQSLILYYYFVLFWLVLIILCHRKSQICHIGLDCKARDWLRNFFFHKNNHVIINGLYMLNIRKLSPYTRYSNRLSKVDTHKEPFSKIILQEEIYNFRPRYFGQQVQSQKLQQSCLILKLLQRLTKCSNFSHITSPESNYSKITPFASHIKNFNYTINENDMGQGWPSTCKWRTIRRMKNSNGYFVKSI